MKSLFAEDIDVDFELRKMDEAKALRRNTDPEPSHLAAEEIVSSGRLGELQSWVLGLVEDYPGKTGSELAVAACVGESYTIKRRLGELDKKGLIRRGEVRQCGVSARQAATWWPIARA